MSRESLLIDQSIKIRGRLEDLKDRVARREEEIKICQKFNEIDQIEIKIKEKELQEVVDQLKKYEI